MSRLTDKQLAEFRANWNACDPMIMALDEIDAMRAEHGNAFEACRKAVLDLCAGAEDVDWLADCVAKLQPPESK